jgi:hypothetical protein
MFDLEQSIAEWRQRMLAAGIQPVPLEELESHLREEIEELVEAGAPEERAFRMAAENIGQAVPLKTEFQKAGFLNWLGDDKNIRINNVFAFFWLLSCLWDFFSVAKPFGHWIAAESFSNITPDLFLAFILGVIFLRGIVASIRLLSGKSSEIRTLKFIAVLGLAAFVAQIIIFKMASPLAIVYAAFMAASLWLMRVPSQGETSIAMK